MGLWSAFLSLFGESTEENKKSSKGPARQRHTRRHTTANVSEGSLLTGRVAYVGNSFAKLESGDTRAVVFMREMANHYVSDPNEVLSEGQAVEFVILERNDRNQDEWVGSIAAVGEARARKVLSGWSEGDIVSGTVSDIKPKGVVVESLGVRVWIPISELAWSWLEHPSSAVHLGETVKAKLLRINEPAGWLKDSRARKAGAVASVRACMDRPESPEVELPMSCLPFKVSAVARKPRSCDPVVAYALEELALGNSQADLQTNTGLPERTLSKILETLEADELARNGLLTQRGRELAEAIGCARDLNSDPIRGLFASASHPTSQFLRRTAVEDGKEYPRGWPRPPFDRRVEDAFNRATDEALPELLLEKVAGEAKRGLLARLQGDERLRVFLRRDGARPWKAVWVPVPEHWILAGLWGRFDAVGTHPYRPVALSNRCRSLLMVRLHGTSLGQGQVHERHQRWLDMYGAENRRDQDFNLPPDNLEQVEEARKAYREQRVAGAVEATIYFEPSTATYWHPREDVKPHFRDRRGGSFPALPNLTEVDEDMGFGTMDWQPTTWCVVGV
jgi:small subunit ribosomal protein S1